MYLLRNTPTRFFQMFVWISLDIILWGFMSKYLTGVTNSGVSFVASLLGAILLWDFLVRVMQGVTMTFFEDVWSKNFLNIFGSPISVAEYVAGLFLSSTATSALVLIVSIILTALVFGFSVATYGILLAPFLVILYLFGIALGIFGISIVLRYGPSAEWFVWPIPAIISPLVGVTYPLKVLPQWMQFVGHLLPPTYVFEGIRAIVAGQQFPIYTLAIATLLALLYIAFAYFVFRSVYRKAIRTGLIARYSAENVN